MGVRTDEMQTSRGLHEAPNKGLTDAQMIGAHLLAQGMKITEVAGALGVHRSTVTRWKQCENFRAAIEVEREKTQNSDDSAKNLAIALATWREIAKDKSQPATARVAAARDLADHALPTVESECDDPAGAAIDFLDSIVRTSHRGLLPVADHERLRDACETALEILDQPRQTPPEPYQVREARERGASESEINELQRKHAPWMQ